jgi:PEP-CTERM motif
MKSKLCGLIAAGLLASSATANALIIEISGQGSANGLWDVTTIYGDFDDLLPTLDDQTWWGNKLLAEAFAVVLDDDFGLPNLGVAGPVFAYGDLGGENSDFDACGYIFGSVNCGRTTDIESTFAVASRFETVPEPLTIALLGFGLVGLRLSQRLKSVRR